MELIDFLGTRKNWVSQSLTVQSVDSDKLVDEQELIKFVCKGANDKKFGLQINY